MFKAILSAPFFLRDNLFILKYSIPCSLFIIRKLDI
jgi:hypothetical protein